jgi:hypothetical protein
MEKLFISYRVEYESGWGQRSAGAVIGKSSDAVTEYVNQNQNQGSYECFWHYCDVEEIILNDKAYQWLLRKSGGLETPFRLDSSGYETMMNKW